MLTSLRERAKTTRTAAGDFDGDGPSEIPASRRLLVLISDADADDDQLPGRLWQLAAQRNGSVALLAMYGGEEAHARIRRQLIGLAAAIRDPRTPVEILTRPGHDWVRQVEALWRPGDLVVCSVGPSDGRGSSPAAQILDSGLNVPVHIIRRMTASPRSAKKSIAQSALTWAGNLGVVVGFFWLQARIDLIAEAPIRIVLFGLSIGVEVGVLWVWNTLAG